ncbi:hypothetical protein [Roseateles sp.]|uniref:hypothetical protein n=1 Tax=Roseateles sp. TaxID=1971397 RepID=UPI003BA45484
MLRAPDPFRCALGRAQIARRQAGSPAGSDFVVEAKHLARYASALRAGQLPGDL